MTTTAPGLPKLGLTLFSLTLEQRKPGNDLAALLNQVVEHDLGPGLEMVAFQSLRGWPRLRSEQAGEVRGLIERSGLTPSCLAINLDFGLYRTRLLSDDEAFDYVAVQLRGAAALGFPTVRVGIECDPKVLMRLLPLAEQLKVKVGVEIHAPMTIDAPAVAALKEFFVKVDSPWLGFIPDFSASMRSVPDALDDAHQDAGVAPELTALAKRLWLEPGLTASKFPELEAKAADYGADDREVGSMKLIFAMHGRMAPERWAEFFPHVVHVHGKFYGIRDGQDPSIDYPSLMKVLRENNYDGFISSEYEAHAYTDRADVYAELRAHHDMEKRLLEGATVESIR